MSSVLSQVLDVRVVAGRRCQPNVSLSLPSGSNLAVQGDIIGFPDRKTCPSAVPLSIFNIGLQAASATDVQDARTAMLRALPRTCFDGILPADTRRHAPPSHMTAWSDSHRILTFVWDEYDPTIFTVTYVRRDLTLPDRAEQNIYNDTRDVMLRPIPPACLDQARP